MLLGSALDSQQCQVIQPWAVFGEASQVVKAGGDYLCGWPPGLLMHEARDAVHTVFVSCTTGLRKAVRVYEQGVASLQLEAGGGELTFAEHPHW